jgi:DNA-binding HxlR family transcriptional regulator
MSSAVREAKLEATCCSREFLEIVSNKWTVIVMKELQNGSMRYGQLNRAVGDITQKVLTDTLRKLERDGMVSRVVYEVVPPKVEYKLTPIGKDILTIMDSVSAWTDKHFDKIEHARSKFDTRTNDPLIV